MSDTEKSFPDLKLNKQLLNALEEAGMDNPTEIQQKAIPLITAGHDVLGIAPTGTGKTAAFVLPVLKKLNYAQGNDPRALILCPTRELAKQIGDHVSKLSTYLDLRYAILTGGGAIKHQREALEGGTDIIIATPGRFMELYREQRIFVKTIKTLVLDEADKMMDMGFMPQIRKILEIIPTKRQNLLFSATMSDRVIGLSEEFLAFPEKVEAKPSATVAETIEHFYYKVPNFMTKIHLLDHLLSREEMTKVLIFVKTKATANNIFKFVERKVDKSALIIHGNKAVNTRMNAITTFKEGDCRILVATDVVARGIDITMVSHVINFELPVVYEDYVHRIGRTGRAGNDGLAISFVSPNDQYHLSKIERIIKQPITEESFPEHIKIEETPKEERLTMEREIDYQKRKEDPNYKGAFHEKKSKLSSKKQKRSSRRRK